MIERFKSPLPPQAHIPGPGAYNVQDINPVINLKKGVTIKSRPAIDEYRETRRVPGIFLIFFSSSNFIIIIIIQIYRSRCIPSTKNSCYTKF